MGWKLSIRDVVVMIGVVLACLVLFLRVIVYPGLDLAREKGRQAACRNNLRQIGIAIEKFRQDHGGRYMRAGDDAELPDEGFIVGAAIDVFDSSLTLALLHDKYIEWAPDFFECPSTDHPFEFTKDKSAIGVGNIDADGDNDFADARFLSDISADCDPDYLIDPRIPTQAAATRIIMACGPDLQHERFWKKPWADDPSSFDAKEVSNHPNRVIVLRADYSVSTLNIERSTGKAANLDTEGEIGHDEDIYDDDDMLVAGEHQGDEKVDCNLGNYRFYTPDPKDAPGLTGVTPRGLWHAGPDWDQAPTPSKSPWWHF